MAAASVISACSSSTPASEQAALSAIVGQTFAEAEAAFPEDATYLIQDASPIVDMAPSFSVEQIGQSEWTVVGICTNAPRLRDATEIELAVVPTSSSPDLDALDLTGVVRCEGRPYRG